MCSGVNHQTNFDKALLHATFCDHIYYIIVLLGVVGDGSHLAVSFIVVVHVLFFVFLDQQMEETEWRSKMRWFW